VVVHLCNPSTPSLGYVVNLRPVWGYIEKSCLKEKNKTNKPTTFICFYLKFKFDWAF
jgi:hypothetical protein